ncbi:MAG: UDP-N-acetylmuramate:L-alanyl-gamma-D-glutamyl-meso-diaminopimelate ligase [Gammaproteobacteria bacterium 28-57-27]|nr:MAG: UDP-N-acetylmuramate:L-alanyl-gamma-D-glutamyl-meso-diaminopimelate ligase [Gammaproteobacteria bacterium 28-57-27]
MSHFNLGGAVHILGIAGTFMGGLAQLAKAAGYVVSGADRQVYSPMREQLEAAGIPWVEGYEAAQLDGFDGEVVVGNVMRRGMPIAETMLDRGMRYTSGPEWLGRHILQGRWVLAVAGTHGKTTTSSMLAWILEYAGLNPGFLIGGVPTNFGCSARLGGGSFFVIEADEYDTAFFDKRSKFVHYRPHTVILNNLEFDHADIFPDLAAIQTQFHHLLRMIPPSGLIVKPQGDAALDAVLERGCWTPVETFGTGGAWSVGAADADGSRFEVLLDGVLQGTVQWSQLGAHNVSNALAALAAARHAGVPVAVGIAALAQFSGVKRRLEVRGVVDGVTLYDDFAHHPTAIRTTLEGLRARIGEARLLVALDPRSNTMRMGVHADTLADSLAAADAVWLFQPEDAGWDVRRVAQGLACPSWSGGEVGAMVADVLAQLRPGDHLVLMSNGSFGGAHERVLQGLRERSV